MKIAVFLSVLFCSCLAAPYPQEGGAAYGNSGPTQYSKPAPAGGLAKAAAAPAGPATIHAINAHAASGAAAAGGAALAGGATAVGGAVAAGASKKAAAVVGIVRDARVVDKSGTYSFDVAGEDGIARQESGAALPEGGITQTGSYTYTQPDGITFEMKYIADANGFQPDSSNLPELPKFVLDQIEFAKNNPEPEGGAARAATGTKVGAAAGAGAGAGAGVAAGARGKAPAVAKSGAGAPGSGYNPYVKR